MADNYDQWCERIKPAIDNSGDSATVVSVLTDAREQYRELYSENVAKSDEIKKLTEENDRLKETNKELFLRIGQQMQEKPVEQTDKSSAETITVADLFKEDK